MPLIFGRRSVAGAGAWIGEIQTERKVRVSNFQIWFQRNGWMGEKTWDSEKRPRGKRGRKNWLQNKFFSKGEKERDSDFVLEETCQGEEAFIINSIAFKREPNQTKASQEQKKLLLLELKQPKESHSHPYGLVRCEGGFWECVCVCERECMGERRRRRFGGYLTRDGAVKRWPYWEAQPEGEEATLGGCYPCEGEGASEMEKCVWISIAVLKAEEKKKEKRKPHGGWVVEW